MKGGLLLNVVVRQRAAILELLACEDEPLLVRRNTLLILNLGLNVLDGVGGLDVQGDGLASQSLNENLHTTAEAQDEVEGALLLDVVIRESPAVLKLLTGEDQALLVGRDALLVLDLSLDVLNRVGSLNVERDGLAGESLDKNLHLLVCF